MALVSKKKRPRREDKPFKEALKITGRALDDPTIDVIIGFLNGKLLKSLDYPLAEGKESVVFRATAGVKGEVQTHCTFFAVKIFKYEPSAFRHMDAYIAGDPRFANVASNRRALVKQWSGKEFANLKTSFEANVPVPHPFKRRENVVVMEFIGTPDGRPFALLRDVVLADPQAFRLAVLEGMRRMYNAGLVHADLSPYNIIVREVEGAQLPVFIDVGQSVRLEHPRSKEFLEHDVRTMMDYFKKQGVETDFEKELAFVKGVSDGS